MKRYAGDFEDGITLKKIYARKFLYHIEKNDENMYGDTLLPLTDNCYEGNNQSNYDLVFI